MIGPKVTQEIRDIFNELLSVHEKSIQAAYAKEGTVTVAMSFKLAPSEVKADSIDVTGGINFVAERVKDSIKATVTENQVDLPLGDKVYKMGRE